LMISCTEMRIMDRFPFDLVMDGHNKPFNSIAEWGRVCKFL